jgi:triosephosphate isomerase
MRPLIGTSWKMNLTSAQAEAWLRAAAPLVGGLDDRDLFVLPPFPALWVARRELAGTAIAWGAQDVHPADRGAHTGDVSAEMLVDLGCTYVEVGHSERRTAHGETDALVGAKVRAALRWGLAPILCVGERRASGLEVARRTVARQLRASLEGLAGPDLERVAVAYEPAWAIGVGATAAPLAHIGAIHAWIHDWLGERDAAATRVIYGGSIDAANASAILGTLGVDGLFVGRAALDPEVFAAIARITAGAPPVTARRSEAPR